MSILLRAGLVIGLITYHSPVRDAGEELRLDELFAVVVGSAEKLAPAALPATLADAERLWSALPKESREGVLAKLRAETAPFKAGSEAGLRRAGERTGRSEGLERRPQPPAPPERGRDADALKSPKPRRAPISRSRET